MSRPDPTAVAVNRPGPSAVIVNRRPILGELATWLDGVDRPVTVLTCVSSAVDEQALARLRRRAEVRLLDDYDGAATEELIERVCRTTRAGVLISTTEADVLRCARIRHRCGIAGQSPASATAYRDKSVMKEHLRAAGLPTARMARADDRAAIAALLHDRGFPLVVKPARGVASKNTHVVRDTAHLDRVLAGLADPAGVIVEEFVHGDMWHVDGLMDDGAVVQCWPSRYLHPQWETMYHSKPNLSAMLPAGDPVGAALVRSVRAVVAALPAAPGRHPFHAEFFATAPDEPVLCEIACRAGGAGIVEAYERAFGVNLYGAAVTGQLGVPVAALAAVPEMPHGWGWFPPRAGVLTALPSSCPIPGVVAYRALAGPGQHLSSPGAVTDAVVEVCFRADPGTPVTTRLADFDAWWAREARWS
ncbi:hypothetical protein [Actinoplanes sp. NPDC051851]|uniref:ATP-grasp domain-containing protein n=1 Tax=Actinoplanes sp. NPDC051851 TaxID=3154753 RepID=UPI003419C0AE